jgi:hypothetical protein
VSFNVQIREQPESVPRPTTGPARGAARPPRQVIPLLLPLIGHVLALRLVARTWAGR